VIKYTQGNLLEADVDALVNTVNTVGVMGKGIALMFKERFADNAKRYIAACKRNEVQIGKMFVTEPLELDGPKWIVNFPTKREWYAPSRLEWIESGLQDLRRFVLDAKIRSIAIPPLGAGNGKLKWDDVRQLIESTLSDLEGVDVRVYEPTKQYQNVAKRSGVETLTPARALIAELIRRYGVLGMECTLLEVQKLAWLLERTLTKMAGSNPLDLRFKADRYGPYADRLRHLLNEIDGSYIHCEKRINDAGPLDLIWFNHERKDYLATYLRGSEFRPYRDALDSTIRLIDGFESPFGMELLATVDWLLAEKVSQPEIGSVKSGLRRWASGIPGASDRKIELFSDHNVAIALRRLTDESAGLVS
jgi:O-acetyl-ADP-ribose deacetylase (regulator of RNase III)